LPRALREEGKFEEAVADARSFTNRAFKAVVNAAAIEQERAEYRARVKQGGTVADLKALAASGYRAGVICPDPPWPFETYSVQGRQRSPDRNYSTRPVSRIVCAQGARGLDDVGQRGAAMMDAVLMLCVIGVIAIALATDIGAAVAWLRRRWR
jgi:hypothetical protein